MPSTDKVKGPASYFPSIEKTYGQPIAHWLDLVQAQSGKKHMELVAMLKNDHGLGHGHANALVAFHKSRQSSSRGRTDFSWVTRSACHRR